ncbi:uncharacterized protein PGTG_16740 [Puccinia graminis f. sp. tritici CRL 75-36-700-3]|uniref:Uncharacterized protein n=1 Tax=Puccinia graminis f. sp. tritici (strain CRL 75-36-700-3 / race SCCL) TaxID=418459 RepID=E3L2C7_PUCGT|nr:uncharacterized protein PGTG_16740 [Puccinia graminis f. sp. tritici CRL 75-36-700-3]EFP90714.1 hypothetical protein PGTG_16740 [Puccinia graminis f. sp. tritici CRL 75-36-700-3]
MLARGDCMFAITNALAKVYSSLLPRQVGIFPLPEEEPCRLLASSLVNGSKVFAEDESSPACGVCRCSWFLQIRIDPQPLFVEKQLQLFDRINQSRHGLQTSKELRLAMYESIMSVGHLGCQNNSEQNSLSKTE